MDNPMILQIKQWLASPVFPDDAIKTNRAGLLNSILLICLPFTLSLMAGSLAGGRTPPAVIGTLGVFVLVCLALRRWMYQGRIGLVSGAFLAVGLVVITMNVAMLGTVRAPATATYVLLVITAGLLFDLGGIILMTALCSLAVAGLIVGEHVGLLPPPDHTVTITQWVTYTALFAWGGGLIVASLQSVHQALARAEEEIAKRARADKTLHESEERFRALIENLADVVIVIDPDGTLRFVTPSLERVLGYKIEELAGTSLFALVHPDDLSNAIGAIEYRLQHPEVPPGIMQLRVRHKDGSWRWVEGIGDDRRDNPAIGGFIAHVRDITERKRAEETLRESEERFRSAFDNAPNGMALVAPNGQFLKVNQFLAEMLGYSQEELLRKTFLDISHPGDTEISKQLLKQLLAGEKSSAHLEKRYLHKDGHTVWILLRTALYRDSAGVPQYFISHMQDITARKRAEETIARQARTLDAFFTCTVAPLVILDRNFNFVRVNEAYAKACQRDIAEFPGHNHFDFYPSDAKAIFEQVVETKRHYQAIARPFVFADHPEWGVTFWDWILTPLLDDRGEVEFLVFSLNDVTKRARAEEELRRRADEFAALYTTSLEIAAPHDLPALLHVIVERACKLLNAPTGGLYLCDPVKQEARCVVSYNTPRDYTGTVLQYGEGAAGTVAQTGQPLMIDDYGAWSGKAKAFANEPLTAIISVPLVWQNQVMGVIHALDDTGVHPFIQSDLELLTLFANQAAVAVANARLLDAERTARSRTEILATANAALTQTLELDRVLDTLLQYLQLLVPYDSANVMLLENEHILRVWTSRGYERWTDVAKAREIAFDVRVNAILSESVSQRRSVLIADTRTHPGLERVSGGEHVLSWIGVPLIVGGRIIGLYSIDKAIPNFFTTEHVRLAESLAAQAAVAIQNARLLEETRHYVGDLFALNQASLVFAQLHTPALIGAQVIRTLETLLTWKRGAVWLVGEQGRLELLAHSEVGPSGDALAAEIARVRTLITRPGEGICGWVAQHGKTVRSGDVRSDPRYVDADAATQSELCVPLQVGGRTIGALNVESTQPNAFSEHDEQVLTILASQTATAVENARLLEAERAAMSQMQVLSRRLVETEEAERRRLAQELHDSVGQNLTGLSLNLNIVKSQLTPESAEPIGARLEDSLRLVDSTGEKIRDVMASLRPAVLDDYGLGAALRWYADQFARRSGIPVEIVSAELMPRPSIAVETALYRIAQEALTNIARHARASRVTLSVETFDSRVRLTIADNGTGFDPHAPRPPSERAGMGLLGMRERAEAVGGVFTVESETGKGTRVVVEVRRG